MSARRWRFAAVAAALTLGLITTGCSPDGAGDGSDALTPDGLVQHIDAGSFGSGAAPQRNFNPFSPTRDITGYTYEPLYEVGAVACQQYPWLATSYHWDDPAQLTFTLRKGVDWQDGRAFTAADVAYTYNLLKKYPALDQYGVWQYIKSVRAQGDGKVVFDFKGPSATVLPTITKVVIVPQHIWSKVKNPVTWTDPDPVGTGPYTLKSFTSERMVLERDPEYWQADRVRVKELWFTRSVMGGEVDQLRLVRGQFDYNLMFVPSIDKTYVKADPEHNHYWFPSGGIISLYMNMKKKPFDDLGFRKALVYAFDRQSIADKAEYGYVRTASQTGLVLPNQQKLLATPVADQGRMPYDPARAAKMLTAAGYKLDSSGHRLGRDGKPLSLTLEVPAGWTDWVQAAQIMRAGFEKVGIQTQVATPSPPQEMNDQALGTFDMIFGVYSGDCNVDYDMAQSLSSKLSAPIGKTAVSNYARWEDPATDGLLGDLSNATTPAARTRAMAGLERIMLDKVPNIPLWYGGLWFEDRTAKVTGWPSAADPYAGPSDSLVQITHLVPVKH